MARIRKPTVKIVLMKHKILQNGEYPIALRVTFDRKSRYFVLKDESKTLSCKVNKWSMEFGRYNRGKDSNSLLTAYENKTTKVLDNLSDTDFTFSRFEDKYFRKQKRIDVFGYFNECIDKLKSDNSLGTAECYRNSLNRIREFTRDRKITFQDIDLNFLERFESHFRNKGNNANSISIYLRTLRAVYNRAIKDNHVSHDLYPFRYFKIRSGYAPKRALSKDSINQLMKHIVEKGSFKWHSLNYFIFSYLCRGINFKDIANLRWKENIVGDKLYYVRFKTVHTKSAPEPTIIKIEPEIAQILSHYSSNDPYIFPILEPGLSEITKRHRTRDTLKKVNKQLKEIAKEVGLQEADQLTFYWGRHTFATVLKRSGVSTAIISEALGHSNEKTTQAYLDKFENEQLDETYKHLI